MHFFLLCCIVLLSGCWSSQRQEAMESVETRTGIEAGQQTNLTIHKQEVSKEQGNAGVDLASLVTSAIAASQGRIMDALAGLKPQPIDWNPVLGKLDLLKPQQTPTVADIAGATAQMIAAKTPAKDYTNEIGLGISNLVAFIMVWLKSKDAAAHKEDAADKTEKLIELAKQLPPPKA